MTIEKALEDVLYNFGRAWIENKKGVENMGDPVVYGLQKTLEKAQKEAEDERHHGEDS